MLCDEAPASSPPGHGNAVAASWEPQAASDVGPCSLSSLHVPADVMASFYMLQL